MGAVALVTSVMVSAGPLGGALGFLLSLAYMLVATMARVANLFELVSLRWAAAHIAWDSLRSLDEHARDGVRRAIPLAILMYFFQVDGGRDAFWTFFAAYLVLLVPGKSPKSQALARVGCTLFGVLLLAVASLVVPDRVLFSFGIIILFAGIGLSPAYTVVGGALTTIGSVLLAGAPTGAIGDWAGRRLLDTIAGCAIALVFTYLLWPRDRESEEAAAVPAPT